MKKKTRKILFGVASAIVALPLTFFFAFTIWPGVPFFDPLPKGEGSYEELDALFKQFRKYRQTGNRSDLPLGAYKMHGYENTPETWMICYATASHGMGRMRRGGTIILMGSDGRIDGYFGHHCSGGDGGLVIPPKYLTSDWRPDGTYESFDQVRNCYAASFKLQRTEPAVPVEDNRPSD